MLCCSIGIYIATLHVFDPRQPGKMVHKPRKTFLALPQCLLCLLALGDIQGNDNCLPEGVKQGRLLSPVDASLMLGLVAERLTREILPEPSFQPCTLLAWEGLCNGATFQHLARKPKCIRHRSICDQVAQVFIHHVDTATRNAAGNCSI